MKNTLLILITLLTSITILHCTNGNQSQNQSTSISIQGTSSQGVDEVQLPKNRIELYYFHATRRCPTCTNAQAYLETTLNSTFASQIERKLLVYRTVNFEKPENKVLSERFKIPFNGLVINVIIDSNESNYFVEDLFQKVHEGEESTIAFLREVINRELKKL